MAENNGSKFIKSVKNFPKKVKESDVVDDYARRFGIEKPAYTNRQLTRGLVTDTLPDEQATEAILTAQNRARKLRGFASQELNPIDYLNDKSLSKKEIIEASMRNIRAENIEQATKQQVSEELSNTPNRDKLRKLTAAQILQLQALNSGGVK